MNTLVRQMLVPMLSLLLLLPAPYARSMPDDTEEDLEGFSQQLIRGEKAARALRKGKAYFEQGSYEQARKQMTDALTLDENLHEARFCLGLTEYRDGNFKLSVAHLENLYERVPSYKNISLELARGYLALGRCPEAQIWIKRHIGKKKSSKEASKLKREIDKCSKKRGKNR